MIEGVLALGVLRGVIEWLQGGLEVFVLDHQGFGEFECFLSHGWLLAKG